MDPLPSQGTIHDILVSEFPTSFLSSFFVVRAPRFYNASCDFLSESGSLMSCNRGVAQVCMFTGEIQIIFGSFCHFGIASRPKCNFLEDFDSLTFFSLQRLDFLALNYWVVSNALVAPSHSGRPWSSWRSTYLLQPHTTLPMTNFACVQDPRPYRPSDEASL